MSQQIDAVIIDRIKQQDAKAFEQVYDHYSAPIFGLILRILKREDLAEDCLHDVFLKVWTNINQFDAEKSSFLTWISVIARNSAIDQYRSKYNKGIQSIESIVYNESTTNTETKVAHIGLSDLVNKLKPEFAEVINEIYYNDLTHEEAAEKLKLPLGTLKTRVRSALQELKMIFKK